MSTKKKILVAAGVAITAFLVYQIVKRKKKEKKISIRIAEEGYETAEDILFPKRKFLRFV